MLKRIAAKATSERLNARLRPMPCGCIEYAGAVNNSGYVKLNFRLDGQHIQVYAHRLFWVLHNGREIPSNMTVDHKCQNSKCVNPEHLQLVTQTTNSRLVHLRKRLASKVRSR